MKSEKSHYPGPINVMTVREVSAYLQVHPSTIYRLLKHTQIRPSTWAATGASISKPSTTGA